MIGIRERRKKVDPAVEIQCVVEGFNLLFKERNG